VRHDRDALGDKIVDSPAWEKRDPQFRKLLQIVKDENGKSVGRAHPFSAYERNGFFVNAGNGSAFVKFSALSGADNPADSRSFALLDYDSDGDQDFALVNANSPSFNLYRTQTPTAGNFLAITLSGGARPGAPTSPPLSNRDAIGARLTIKTPSGLSLTRTLNAGEGYGAQNSKTLIIGLGPDTHASSLRIRWPGGLTSEIAGPIEGRQRLHLEESATGTKHSLSSYPAKPGVAPRNR
jgi:hypothetical protein